MNGSLVRLVMAGAIAGASFAALPAGPALAQTQCTANFNAGITGSGSTWQGWCNTLGGFVRFRMTLYCPLGGGGTTSWETGSGGTVYTHDSETCWFGKSPTGYKIENG